MAAQWMGWKNIFHCEYNKFCQQILKYHFPDAISYGNIYETDFTIHAGTIDILTGGFPCQPFSTAGKRKGSDDDRHLWPQMLRAIREVKPTWVVAENVPGLLTIENGVVFESVCADLEDEGYEVQAFIIPACATNADHRRDRIWIVAFNSKYNGFNGSENRKSGIKGGYNNKKGEDENEQPQRSIISRNPSKNSERIRCGSSEREEEPEDGRFWKFSARDDDGIYSEHIITNSESKQSKSGVFTELITTEQGKLRGSIEHGTTSNTRSQRQQGSGKHRRPSDSKENGIRQVNRTINGDQFKESWVEAATRLCIVDDGLSGRLDGITVPKWRKESLMAAGNAIVPSVAFEIFKAIQNNDCPNI